MPSIVWYAFWTNTLAEKCQIFQFYFASLLHWTFGLVGMAGDGNSYRKACTICCTGWHQTIHCKASNNCPWLSKPIMLIRARFVRMGLYAVVEEFSENWRNCQEIKKKNWVCGSAGTSNHNWCGHQHRVSTQKSFLHWIAPKACHWPGVISISAWIVLPASTLPFPSNLRHLN